MDALTNGVTIKVGSASYHSFADFGLAIGNTDYIGEPEYESYYVDVPGRDGFLDLSETVSGRVIYKKRKISIELGGIGTCNGWDATISNMRNLFHGKTVQLIFDNDTDWYWTGRAEINDYDRFRNMGTFKLEIPQADPFKYGINIVPDLANIAVNHTVKKITIPVAGVPVNPEFVVENLQLSSPTGYLHITRRDSTDTDIASTTVTENGTYRFYNLWFESGDKVSLSVQGSATVSIVYRQVSL